MNILLLAVGEIPYVARIKDNTKSCKHFTSDRLQNDTTKSCKIYPVKTTLNLLVRLLLLKCLGNNEAVTYSLYTTLAYAGIAKSKNSKEK